MVLIEIAQLVSYGDFNVSVPLRGLWFLSMNFDGEVNDVTLQFPSPYGDYGSYRVPVLIFVISNLEFPSPYGDYGSYQEIDRREQYKGQDCFRPLTGIMVLIVI